MTRLGLKSKLITNTLFIPPNPIAFVSYLYDLPVLLRGLQYLAESTGTNYSLLDKIQRPEVRKIPGFARLIVFLCYICIILSCTRQIYLFVDFEKFGNFRIESP